MAQLFEEIATRVELTVNANPDKRQHPDDMNVTSVETASVKPESYV